MAAQFREGFQRFRVNIRFERNPTSPLTHEAQEKRTALVDITQAYLYHPLVFLGICGADTPAQVNVPKLKLPPGAPKPQLREYPLHQQVTFGVHIIKGGTDENIYGFPIHGITPLCLRVIYCNYITVFESMQQKKNLI